jgi:hypothetical protein
VGGGGMVDISGASSLSSTERKARRSAQPGQQSCKVVADGGEHSVGRVAFAAEQKVAAHPMVALEVADHRLDRGSSLQLSPDLPRHTALLIRWEAIMGIRRGVSRHVSRRASAARWMSSSMTSTRKAPSPAQPETRRRSRAAFSSFLNGATHLGADACRIARSSALARHARSRSISYKLNSERKVG